MTVSYARAGDIGIITIDNPPVNALSGAVRAGLVQAADAFAADDGARAAVIRCAGRTFVAGADLSEFGKPPAPPPLPEVIARIERLEKPVVAAIHGTALGGGLELALGAHWRVALPDAQMGLPEVTLGLIPGAGGTQRLPRLIGLEPALRAITRARRIGAAEGLTLGLVDHVDAAAADARAAGLAFAQGLLARGAGVRRTADMAPPAPDTGLERRIRDELDRAFPGQIAPGVAVDAVMQGLGVDFAQGMAAERARFVALMDSPQRAALIHAFFSERRVADLPKARPAGAAPAPRPFERIGVIGGGTMGAGIATAGLLSGLSVTLAERDAAAAARAENTVRGMLDGAVRRGKLDAAARDEALARRLSTADGFSALAGADVLIEAVFEDLAVKRQVFAELDRVARPGAVLATNTSYLDVAAIAQATGRPQDVIGLHFFAPAHVMRLLEIIVPGGAAPDAVATGFALARRLGKIAVRAGNADGFIGNRMLARYRAAADAMVLDGASPYRIDRVLVAFGFAMGPYAVADLAGLDVGWMARQRRAAGRHPRDRVPVLADRLYERGRLGRKTGRGYYLYDEARPQGAEDGDVLALLDQVRADLGIRPRHFGDDEIVARYMAAMVDEGARVVGEGIAARPLDVDVVLLNGYGFPRWKGGPMHWADAQGLAGIARDIHRFARDDDHFWQVAPLLDRLAARDGRFADLNGGVP